MQSVRAAGFSGLLPSAAGFMSGAVGSRTKEATERRKKKQRSWTFLVSGIKADGPKITYKQVLSSFAERYTAVKRLVISPSSGSGGVSINTWENARVVVDFRGPTPGSGPAKILRQLLNAASVEAQPVAAGCGRRSKRARPEGGSSDASDSEAEVDSAKKTKQPGFPGSPEKTQAHDGADRCNASSKRASSSSGGCVGGESRTLPGGEGPMTSPATSAPARDRSTGSSSPSLETASLSQEVSPEQTLMQWDDMLRHFDPSASSTVRQDSPHVGGAFASSERENSHEDELVEFDEFEPLYPNLMDGFIGEPGWGEDDIGDEGEDAMPSLNTTPSVMTGWSSNSVGLGIINGGFSTSVQIERDGGRNSNIVGDSSAQTNVLPMGVDLGWGFSLGVSDATNARLGSGSEQGKASPPPLASAQSAQMKPISVEPSHKECDFEGAPEPISASESGTAYGPDCGCRLDFSGLESVLQVFPGVTVKAHFWVDSGRRVGVTASPIQVTATGRTYATVRYPSMEQLWPELYNAANVQTVKVDMFVEVLSADGNFHYAAPTLQVMYRRRQSQSKT